MRTDMRGATALPWSETPLRMNGTRRNRQLTANPLWRIWVTTESRGDETVAEEVRSRRLRITDDASNNWWEPAAEMAEGRRPIGGKVSGDACPGLRPGNGMHEAANLRISGVHNRDRVRPLKEPGAGKPPPGLCGGNGETRSLPRQPHLKKQYVIPPEASAAFVANMEDVLDVYHRPRDPNARSSLGRDLEAVDRRNPRANRGQPGTARTDRLRVRAHGTANIHAVAPWKAGATSR